IFLAGASGVVGRRLVPLLIGAGHQVSGTTRSAEKAEDIARAGAAAVVVDVFDAAALARTGEGAATARGVLALERLVTGTPGFDGIVLRYGRFYGPGTWRTEAGGRGCLHVDAAAHAALLAVTRGAAGIYN